MKINLSVVKAIYKKIPYPLTKVLEFVPFSVFCGCEYKRQFSLIKRNDIKTGSPQHLELLLSFANEVIKNVPFYIRYCQENNIDSLKSLNDFRLLPFIDKEFVQKNYEDFIDPRYESLAYNVSTGGTTGKQLSFLMSNSAYAREWAFVNSFIREIGGDENSRRLCLRGVSGIKENELIGYNPLYKEMLISPFHLKEETVDKYIKKIIAYKPKWIHGYPSSVALFAKILKQKDITIPSIQFVLLVSEKLYDEQRLVISDVFGNNIHSFYGMSERVIFAPLRENGFEPEPLYCFVEEVDNELIGTGFLNKVFPILRYKTGDSANTIKDSNDIVKIVPNILGRWGKECLVGISKIEISMTSLNVHCDTLNSIEKYQFVQDKIGECYIDLVPQEISSTVMSLK